MSAPADLSQTTGPEDVAAAQKLPAQAEFNIFQKQRVMEWARNEDVAVMKEMLVDLRNFLYTLNLREVSKWNAAKTIPNIPDIGIVFVQFRNYMNSQWLPDEPPSLETVRHTHANISFLCWTALMCAKKVTVAMKRKQLSSVVVNPCLNAALMIASGVVGSTSHSLSAIAATASTDQPAEAAASKPAAKPAAPRKKRAPSEVDGEPKAKKPRAPKKDKSAKTSMVSADDSPVVEEGIPIDDPLAVPPLPAATPTAAPTATPETSSVTTAPEAGN